MYRQPSELCLDILPESLSWVELQVFILPRGLVGINGLLSEYLLSTYPHLRMAVT